MIDGKHWDWETGQKKIPMADWQDRFDWVEEPYVSPDGEKVALAGKRRSGDHPAPLLLEDKDGALLHRFGDVANTYSVAFSPDGRYLLAGTRYDAGTIAGQIHLFDLESYDLVRTYDMGAGFETADVHKVAFSNVPISRSARPLATRISSSLIPPAAQFCSISSTPPENWADWQFRRITPKLPLVKSK